MSAFITANPFATGVENLDVIAVKYPSSSPFGFFIGGAQSDQEVAMTCNWNSQYQCVAASGMIDLGADTPGLTSAEDPEGTRNANPDDGWMRNSEAAAWEIEYEDAHAWGSNQVQLDGPSFTAHGRTDLGHDEPSSSGWMPVAQIAAIPSGTMPAEWYSAQVQVRVTAFFRPYSVRTAVGFAEMAGVPYWWATGIVLVDAQLRLTGAGHLTGAAPPLVIPGKGPFPSSGPNPSEWVTMASPFAAQDPADHVRVGYTMRYAELDLPRSPSEGPGVGSAALTKVAILEVPSPPVGRLGFDITKLRMSCMTPYLRRADLGGA